MMKRPRITAFKIDPSRTLTLQRLFLSDLKRRFVLLRKRILEYFNSHGQPFLNAEFDASKLEEFQRWLAAQENQILELYPSTDAWWMDYIKKAHAKGVGRAYDQVRKPMLARLKPTFDIGPREQFLRDQLRNPRLLETVKILAARNYSELRGITEAMDREITRTLVEGFIRQWSYERIGREIASKVESIGLARAAQLARYEIVKASAEGQLDAYEALGVTHIGVAVEWVTAGDERVCPACASMQGVILTVQEARGLIPRHIGCRCGFIPANVGESMKGQIRAQLAIQKRIARSQRQMPNDWATKVKIKKRRPVRRGALK